ncbi:MAG: NADP-dependent malic enzyme [Euryarchaeota archaeon]|nr:NADP-dependent malic enzyme [Euryarchaeota archaeon]
MKSTKSEDESLRKRALEYHAKTPRGKIKIVPTKPHSTARELSLAYSPGVAYPCLEIAKNPEDSYLYTSKGNLVAVISNGSAVLGLGNIGALASKPVMEGKGLLFKTFADIDVFDIEVDASDPEEFIKTVCNIAPTFGGINLEDIKAPECFEIEKRISEQTSIPVMHDDQHGTAIITGAALINAVELQQKRISELKVVIAGAGASAIACANHYVAIGINPLNIVMCDSKGILTKSRLQLGELNQYKAPYARDLYDGDLASAMVGADLFLGLSKGGVVSKEMVMSMAEKPIIFALANPTPEIMPDEIKSVRDDAIIATGRSDFPNQVNNVLGFPYIFRGALDVRATDITQGMKMAATEALAALAKEPVPEEVQLAYGGNNLTYGKEYIIPKPFDRRVLIWEASAVAQAAVDEGVSGISPGIFNYQYYRDSLESRLGLTHNVMRGVINEVKGKKQKIVFQEGENPKVLMAVSECIREDICIPVLLGDVEQIEQAKLDLTLKFNCEIIDPKSCENRLGKYSEYLFEKRSRKGVTLADAQRLLKSRPYYGSVMVACGDADGLLGGLDRNYPDVLKPAIQVIGKDESAHCLVGCYMMSVKGKLMFLADATVNVYPDSRTLAEIAVQTAVIARRFGVTPRIAMLSFSNFGSSQKQRTERLEDAISLAKELDPTLIIDGPMQGDTALNPEIQSDYGFMSLDGPANVLICPNLASANIAYKLLSELGDAEMTGPILEGLAKPVQVLARYDGARHIIHMAAVCAQDSLRGIHPQKRLRF